MLFHEVHGVPPASEVPQVLAIGKFDGVHIGHQAILDAARREARLGERLAVLSFEPHPTYALTGNPEYLRTLTPRAEKVRLLAELGVGAYYAAQFNREFQSLTPDAFVETYLPSLAVRHVVVGDDFRFGRGGSGTIEVLRELAQRLGIGVTVVPPVEEGAHKVGSSQIRAHLAAGRVEAAEALLGRPYALTGTVVHGDKRGRLIGFPTANLGGIDQYVMPASGVYAVAVALLDETSSESHWFGVLNAGFRPTVEGTTFRVEVHLLGFSGDLYGRECRVSFLRRIRDERKFAGLDELKAQIERDCDVARELLGLS
ncbi:FMN adenylyltransferase /riboflavin kinase [Alicyclobacillus sacchari]|uniref:Riboflavin biosynthesis protein n=1 Tax=Alicyclobacillus sacchari TaxID=392010 RepID=A0A4R8LUP9_9BACL|nr:bifunctional riboflavin kinase/FAD synthetase [Alicyclobacillus sacchari]TDY50525.1 FMN adenylyltransferase /riboflavin kinase [Alicyclobacillus sacchari]GMA59067.1 riboflavin biosynthesis protein [Alicyclobacillus sacchari]